MATVKPFDAGNWFPIHNRVFDVIMPGLSPGAWKALCVAIRQAWGSTDASGDPTEGQKWGCLSDSQFQDRMGCESRATVSMALLECVEAGYLVRHEIKEEQAEPIYVYALNRDLQFEVADDSDATSVETGLIKQEIKRDDGDGDDGVMPADQFLIAAWRLATGVEVTGDELDALFELLGPDQTFGTLANVILEIGRRVDNVTIELVQAIVTGRISMPSLEELEEPPPPSEPPHGPVMATTSTTATDPLLADVIKMYESEIGLVTERTSQHLMALTEEHRDLDKWRKAFDAVVRSNIRRLDYLVTCLENVGKPKSKKPGRRGGGRGQRQERTPVGRQTVREKPPAEDMDAETVARQKAALAEWRKQRERERK